MPDATSTPYEAALEEALARLAASADAGAEVEGLVRHLEVLAAPILDEQPDLNGRLEQAPALPQGATLADPAARQRLTVLVQAFARAGLLDAPRLEEPARQAQAP
jgi:hypothetical protein